jgi:ferritin
LPRFKTEPGYLKNKKNRIYKNAISGVINHIIKQYQEKATDCNKILNFMKILGQNWRLLIIGGLICHH